MDNDRHTNQYFYPPEVTIVWRIYKKPEESICFPPVFLCTIFPIFAAFILKSNKNDYRKN